MDDHVIDLILAVFLGLPADGIQGIINEMRIDLRLEHPDLRYALFFLFLPDPGDKAADLRGHFVKADLQRGDFVGGIPADFRILIQIKMLHGFFQTDQMPDQPGGKPVGQNEGEDQDQKIGDQKREKQPVHLAENGLIGQNAGDL